MLGTLPKPGLWMILFQNRQSYASLVGSTEVYFPLTRRLVHRALPLINEVSEAPLRGRPKLVLTLVQIQRTLVLVHGRPADDDVRSLSAPARSSIAI